MYEILTILLISIPIGLVIGIYTRKKSPTFCKSYTKFCLNKKWWIFLLGLIMFTVFAINSFNHGQNNYGYYFSIMALFQLFTLIFLGFKGITPEQEEAINKSDPTDLSNIKFWNKK